MALYLAGLALLVVAALAVTLGPTTRTIVTAALGGIGCATCAAAMVPVLRGGSPETFHTSVLFAFVGTDLSLDSLSALFIVTVAVIGVAVFVYTAGYARGEMRSRSALGLLSLFVASLLVVPAAASAVTFMFAWEFMAVTSLLLVLVHQREHADVHSAAQWYGVMTQLGAAAILLGLLLASAKGGQSFAAIHAHAGALSPTIRGAAFVLTLIGFASKAGAVPLHVWLPRAHPAAPSPVSALMSSSMVALGVYGILRVGRVLLGPGALWWWLVVIALGALSAVYGAVHATTSSDLKRLLAYSTIDIVGLVLLGVGCSGALTVTGHGASARLALVGALALLVAHAAYKGGLFLAAGAIERATGTRDLDKLGGLIRRVPLTAACFAVCALSLIAIPTLSGFSSEWLVLEGMLHGFVDRNTPTDIGLLVGVAALALTGGLTAVALVKAFGVGFLGQARSAGAAAAREVPVTMTIAMALLCVPCVVLGVAPGLLAGPLGRAAGVGSHGPTAPVSPGLGLALAHVRGAIEPLALVVALVVAGTLFAALARWRGRGARRRVPAWRGGGNEPTPRMQYTATSFGEPLQRVFADVLRPEADVEVTHTVESRYYEQVLAYESRVDDAFERYGYQPVVRAALAVGVFARRLQNGNVHRYLAFGFVALLVVLVVLA